MLRHLTVRDYALVRAIDVDLEAGLTVLTGESGAGKTILIEALGLVLGDRASAASIRLGAERSEVVAEFEVADNAAACAFLAERGFEDPSDPAICLVRRTVGRDLRSRAFINGSPVNAADLGALAVHLIDIHAQNDHQQLLRRSAQLELIDSYAGTTPLAAEVAGAYRRWRAAASALAATLARVESGRDRSALLRYQVAELEALALEEGEYERLDAQFRRLAKAGATAAVVSQATAALSGEGSADAPSSIDALLHTIRTLDEIVDEHPRLDAARDLLRTAVTHLDEATAELNRYADALTLEPERLAELEHRLERTLDLARKHRLRPEHLASHLSALRDELGALDVDAGDLDAQRAAVTGAEADFRGKAATLSERRRKAAKPFEAAVGRHMRELGIKGGALELVFADTEGESGLDAVEYHVVTNPRQRAAPLAQIASGGERSRISLAIQVVAAAKVRLPSLIIDEADVGIGGATADAVGRLLRELGRHAQVLCVTHAPQVAARGDHHLRIGKSAKGETLIEVLDSEARIEELARMLGGREITSKTRDYAAELIAAGASP
jgi:DNA repair protein RecN (Recombination protein N)